MNAFRSAFASEDRRVVTAESYKLGDPKPIRTIVQKALSQNPDAVFVTGYGPAYFAVFTSLKDYNYKGQVLGCPNIGQPEALATVKNAAENIVFSGTDMELSTPEGEQTRSFAEKYRAAYNAEPFYVASYVYDALGIAESLISKHQSLTPASVSQLASWEGVTGTLRFLPGGECQASMIAIRHADGKNVRAQ
jgi:branched-chain amino acid transport system substrate-binding protein